MNSNFNVIGSTRLGIKTKSTAPEAAALTTRPSQLSNAHEVGRGVGALGSRAGLVSSMRN